MAEILRDDDPRCAELEAAGYRIVGESWGAHLAVTDLAELRARRSRADVRELQPDDARALHGLESQTAPDYPFTPATAHELLDLHQTVALWKPGTRLFGAWDQDVLVAATSISVVGDAADVDFFSVLASHRGRGLGAAVVAAAIIAVVEDDGVTVVGTGGAAVNDASLATVRALGFTVDERWRSYEL